MTGAEVTFVSCRPSPNELIDWKAASFYLIRDDEILYKFPYRFENNSSRGYIGTFYSVGAVGFRDINDDEKEDIIIITYYTQEQDQRVWFHVPVLQYI